MTNEDDGRWRCGSTRTRVLGAGTTKGRCAVGEIDDAKDKVEEVVDKAKDALHRE